MHFSNGICALKSPCLWQSSQATVLCFLSSGYVVESLHPCDLFPVGGVMTGLVGRGKAPLMRIGVTSRALRERESRVFDERLRIRHRRMTLCIGNFFSSVAFTKSRTEVFAKSTYVKRMSGLTQINKALITSNPPHRVLYAA
jgi:hypothetical protein